MNAVCLAIAALFISITMHASPKIILVASNPAQFEVARQALREAGFAAEFSTASDDGPRLFLSDAASLPRSLQVLPAAMKAPAKLQRLSTPLFKGLRLFSPAAALMDLVEGAFDESVLVPNDLDQVPLEPNQKDLAGLRLILGKTGHKRVAIVQGPCFTDATLKLEHPAHDNRAILARVGHWLTGG